MRASSRREWSPYYKRPVKPVARGPLCCIGFKHHRIFVGSLGQVAQLVEQWTENPCVGGSIPSLTTSGTIGLLGCWFRPLHGFLKILELLAAR